MAGLGNVSLELLPSTRVGAQDCRLTHAVEIARERIVMGKVPGLRLGVLDARRPV